MPIVKPQLLILETSHRLGKVALAANDVIVGARALDESRRHARDLAPAIHGLLAEQGWRARDLDGVIVSRGPGSYTGLRVGLMSGKTLAYAAGMPLIAINTFDAIAQNSSPRPSGGEGLGVRGESHNLDVIADAQQGKVYAQRFGTHPEPLAIVPFEMWLESARARHAAVTGPALELYADRVTGVKVLPADSWLPTPVTLLQLGLARLEKGERDDPFAVEPLYLRGSSAEEKWAQLHPG
jgi:tRNA threonylcarbamoyladenosine biosynthesis protein TsaB